MTEFNTVDVFVVIDSNGDYAVGGNDDAALENFDNEVGGDRPRRIVKLNVTMRLPVVTEVSVTVPDEAGQQVTATAE